MNTEKDKKNKWKLCEFTESRYSLRIYLSYTLNLQIDLKIESLTLEQEHLEMGL